MSSTIWAVSSGSYSGYGIVGIFEDKGTAEIVAAQLTGPCDEHYVEEFRLYAAGDTSLRPRPRVQASLMVGFDGLIAEEIEFWHQNPVSETNTEFMPAWVGGYGNAGYRVVSVAADTETAAKAVRERAAEVAQNIVEGVDPMLAENARRAALSDRVDLTP